MNRDFNDSRIDWSPARPSITNLKILSLKLKTISGIETQYHHPIGIKATSPVRPGSMSDAALFALTNGYQTDNNIDLFNEISNAMLEYSLVGKGAIHIPGGWQKERTVFDLEIAVTSTGFSSIEKISGFIEDGEYYPQRSTLSRGFNKLQSDDTCPAPVFRPSSQVAFYYDLKFSGGSEMKYSLMPDDLVSAIDRRELDGHGTEYIDLRQIIHSMPQAAETEIFSITGFIKSWCREIRMTEFGQKAELYQQRGLYPGRNPAQRTSPAMRAIWDCEDGTPSFKLEKLLKVDPTFSKDSIVVEAKDDDAPVDKYRKLPMNGNDATSQYIRNLVNILQSAAVTPGVDMFPVTVNLNKIRQEIHIDTIDIPADMYSSSDSFDFVAAQLKSTVMNLPNWITGVTIRFRLNGNTDVLFDAKDGYAGEHYVTPTYAPGLTSPMITPDQDDLNPLATIFQRMIAA